MIAAFLDLFFRITRLMKKAWAKTVGKVLSATFGAAIFIGALALAKHQVHSIVHADPKYFDDFVNLFAVLLLSIMYVVICMVVLGAFALLQVAFLITA